MILEFWMILVTVNCVQHKVEKEVRPHSELAMALFSIGFGERPWRHMWGQDEEGGGCPLWGPSLRLYLQCSCVPGSPHYFALRLF